MRREEGEGAQRRERRADGIVMTKSLKFVEATTYLQAISRMGFGNELLWETKLRGYVRTRC
jgi:hypothetical protein